MKPKRGFVLPPRCWVALLAALVVDLSEVVYQTENTLMYFIAGGPLFL
jgi:hypothetical protein